MNLCLSCKYRVLYQVLNTGSYTWICAKDAIAANETGSVDCPYYEKEGESKVDHPSYYQGKIEVIDFIEDKELGFHLGNAIKYIARAGKKTPDAKEDIEKAIWYLERYIQTIEGR